MDYTHLIIFKYNNAYDGLSADALSEINHCIDNTIMEKHGVFLFCIDPLPVIEVMREYNFTYKVFDLQWLDNWDLIKSATNFL